MTTLLAETQSGSKSELVKHYLLERLFRQELVPGDIINRRQIAKEVGVSVAPVLEAMLQLENDGYLEVVAKKTTRVRISRPDELYGQLLVREALECQIARLLAAQADELPIDSLTELAVTADKAPETMPQRGEYEVAFHGGLAQATGLPILVQHHRRVIGISLFFLHWLAIPVAERGDDKSHVLLLEEIASGDVAAAEQAVREHMRTEREFLARNAADARVAQRQGDI